MKSILLLGLVTSFGVILCWAIVAYEAPDVAGIKNCITTTINRVYLCPDSKQYLKLTEISDELLNAVVYAEDAGFFFHAGFDWHELKDSLIRNIKNLKYSRGGSTITQQLVKNIYLSSEKTIFRKLKEAFLTRQVETILNKNEILERYLNIVEFGYNTFGIKAAANYYFNKEASELDLLESTYLAHLLPNPKLYSKGFANKRLSDFSRKQIIILCKRLYRFKKVSQTELKEAIEAIDDFPWVEEGWI